MNGPVVTSFNVDDTYSFKQSGNFTNEEAEGEDVSWSYYASGVLKQDQRPEAPKNFAQRDSGSEGIVLPQDGSPLLLA